MQFADFWKRLKNRDRNSLVSAHAGNLRKSNIGNEHRPIRANAGAILGYISLGFLADRFGRKPIVMIFFAMSLIMSCGRRT